jgi:hypothetical protein
MFVLATEPPSIDVPYMRCTVCWGLAETIEDVQNHYFGESVIKGERTCSSGMNDWQFVTFSAEDIEDGAAFNHKLRDLRDVWTERDLQKRVDDDD